MYVAYTEEEIIAVFMLFWDDPARWGQQPPVAGYLHRFVVAPGLRGQNVGGQIMDLICVEVARHDRQYLRLTAPASNKKLQQYHLQNGFVRADHKANPSRLSEPIAFFERPTGNLTPEHFTGTASQGSRVFDKLRRTITSLKRTK
jgi:GNAT superfamily N-acetyltransferase